MQPLANDQHHRGHHHLRHSKLSENAHDSRDPNKHQTSRGKQWHTGGDKAAYSRRLLHRVRPKKRRVPARQPLVPPDLEIPESGERRAKPLLWTARSACSLDVLSELKSSSSPQTAHDPSLLFGRGKKSTPRYRPSVSRLQFARRISASRARPSFRFNYRSLYRMATTTVSNLFIRK
jgi:hypothetical protein